MACLDHQSFCGGISPRISFSNDFVDPNLAMKRERPLGPPPDASDFEFSVSGYTMIAADDIFSKGRLMPLKENCTHQLKQKKSLNDDEEEVSERPVRGPARWKELLGFRRSGHGLGHGMTKKQEVVNSPLVGSTFISNTSTFNKALLQELEIGRGEQRISDQS